ncbi:type II toxin-antitoxin system HicA family toxin [Novispirillum sp. DQ9]|uniref:type II toxin-antitoxin system HicA family toxin n=1 Tax=Novispirillum sp. DQ9 TaxID=3398612 RepID=UPI003C79B182
MNNRHRATLEDIFARPTKANIRWADIEALFKALGANISERAGSRIAIELNDVVAIFHRPHPQPTTKKGAVDSVRAFLKQAGVSP